MPLGLADQGIGSTIKLRGVLPVVITARILDPLVIPLEGAAGKTFRQGTRSVRIAADVNTNARMKSVDFFLNEDAASSDSAGLAAGSQIDYIGDYLHDRIEFIDPQGLPMTWELPVPNPTLTATANVESKPGSIGLFPRPNSHYRLSRLAIESPSILTMSRHLERCTVGTRSAFVPAVGAAIGAIWPTLKSSPSSPSKAVRELFTAERGVEIEPAAHNYESQVLATPEALVCRDFVFSIHNPVF